MNKEVLIQGLNQSVHEAENAVVKAQSVLSPQYSQAADQMLKLASQQLQEAQKFINPSNEVELKHLHRAKEQRSN